MAAPFLGPFHAPGASQYGARRGNIIAARELESRCDEHRLGAFFRTRTPGGRLRFRQASVTRIGWLVQCAVARDAVPMHHPNSRASRRFSSPMQEMTHCMTWKRIFRHLNNWST